MLSLVKAETKDGVSKIRNFQIIKFVQEVLNVKGYPLSTFFARFQDILQCFSSMMEQSK